MTMIYQYDWDSVYTGVAREIGEMDGIPPGWTDVPVPEMPEGKFAVFSYPNWFVLDERPMRPEPEKPSTEGPMVI